MTAYENEDHRESVLLLRTFCTETFKQSFGSVFTELNCKSINFSSVSWHRHGCECGVLKYAWCLSMRATNACWRRRHRQRVNRRSVTIEGDIPTKGNLPLNGDITPNLVITITRCDCKSATTRQVNVCSASTLSHRRPCWFYTPHRTSICSSPFADLTVMLSPLVHCWDWYTPHTVKHCNIVRPASLKRSSHQFSCLFS